ncbi:peptidase T [Actinomyces radicidentis]|uniref:peptidase T n=1 Tax=Actinomyces radicidentis TaxID=111015 RepID=UPI000A037538|nr:peptidase T [Actinomyces radicidentis]
MSDRSSTSGATAPAPVRGAPEGTDLENALAERFLRYSAVPSQSDAARTGLPTSEGQRELARLLADELTAAGAADVHLSETSVLTARIPATDPAAPAIGFCTHLDTVDSGLSPVVRARVVDYDGVSHGGDLVQDAATGTAIRLADHPELARYAGQRILVSDGTSVLGADDKAGVSTVMQLACDLLAADSRTGAGEPHGDVVLSFVPDEEIGLRGVRTMELDRFDVAWAYTLDSCELGEVVEETFNAATCTLTVTGVATHPMRGKGVLVNPILIAAEVIDRLDPSETPEWTEGREGYVWVHDVVGDQSTCTLTISVRDHDRAGYEEKKARLQRIVEEVAAAHPRAGLELVIDDVYANLADARTSANEHALAHVYTALDRLGIAPIPLAMRGGTDGSWLSTQGIFTPNVFTGAHNFHSAAELLPLPSFAASYRVCRELVRLAAGG